MDFLLVGYNLVGTGRKRPIDAFDAEAMFENDGVSTGSDGHKTLSGHVGARSSDGDNRADLDHDIRSKITNAK